MRLYHHSESVRHLVAEQMERYPGASRAAIPLRDSAPTPHVIVTRTGRFVTCLGESMRIGDLPVLPYRTFQQEMDRADALLQDLQRRLEAIRRFDGEELGRAIVEGPGRLTREMAEVFIEGDVVFGRMLCRHLLGSFKLLGRIAAAELRFGFDRQMLIQQTKLEGSIILTCYLLGGIDRPAVTGLLDYFARFPCGFDAEILAALVRHREGADRLLDIALDPTVPDEQRNHAAAYMLPHLRHHPDRAYAILRRVRQLPDDPAVPQFAALRERTAPLLAYSRRGLERRLRAWNAEPQEEFRPQSPCWIFTPDELGRIVGGRYPTTALFPPAAEAAQVRAAWDELVRTRPLPARQKQEPFVRSGPRVGRNEPCPCGSGRKHKHCCLGRAGLPGEGAVTSTLGAP